MTLSNNSGIEESGGGKGAVLEWSSSDCWWLSLTLLCVVIAWCAAYDRWTPARWNVPVIYGSDGWAEMATAKAFAEEGVRPVVQKFPASLGAPFRANWNDHITVEEPIFVSYALLVRLFGLFTGSNLILIAAHLAAAAGFYLAARARAVEPLLASLFALLFAVSTFAIARNLIHLILTFYWHLPLGLVVVWWCLDKTDWTRRRIVIATGIAFLHGVQNPYYTNMFIQLLGLALLAAILQRRPARAVLLPLLFGVIAFGGFVLMNVDTLSYALAHGPNTLINGRTYAGVEIYALKPLELILPFAHRIHAWEQWTNAHYFQQALYVGEPGSPYLGWAGLAGLTWMGCSTVKGIALRDFGRIPRHAWLVLWILFYSVVGGLNGLLGTFGLVLFRATNRYSILILALALLFLGERLGAKTRRWHSLSRAGLWLAVALIAFWDQVPRLQNYPVMSDRHELLEADRNFGRSLEAALPAGTMIFQLPVMDYPEASPIENMTDYEHFRPYLHTHNLRYSYGSDKGRPRERWQTEAAQLEPGQMVNLLERYGFGAILLNKKGYADSGSGLLQGLRVAGRDNMVAQSADFFCVRLNPSRDPLLPPEFDSHWFPLESANGSSWRWAAGNSTIRLHNDASARTIRLSFTLHSNGARHVAIRSQSAVVFEKEFTADTSAAPVELSIAIPPGGSELRFETDRDGAVPGNGDPRKLAFNIKDLKVAE